MSAEQAAAPLLSADNNDSDELFSLVDGSLGPTTAISAPMELTDDQAFADFEKSLGQALAANEDLRVSDKKNIRPPMSASDQVMLCNGLGAQVKMTWPIIIDTNPLVPSTIQVGDETTKCLEETS